ncbi:protein of unknown function [Methylorubrum extorquens]|uniref:DUF4062 domain-containing protein n=1 Tax=Methylorubrum extorquens TaxID=408 RepID=A0A2N9AM70_METEX|nr:protein of unknown function [Methylorubrum extorquens]
MEKKYQIFVSSTFQDLELERRVAIEQVLNLGHIPVGMELFQASDDSQWNYIKQRIDECDYYVVIVAERYGAEQDGKSFTQMEYEYAVARGVPTIAFLLHEAARASWPQSKIEFEKKDTLNKFRDICSQKLVKFWKNSDDLGSKVISSLVELTRHRPRTGWVRADTAATPAALNEIAKLSEEKRNLQKAVEDLRQQVSEPKLSADIEHRIKILSETMAASFFPDNIEIDDEVSMLLLFHEINRSFSTGCKLWTAMKAVNVSLGIKDNHRNSVINLLGEYAAYNLLDVERTQEHSGGTIHSVDVYKSTEFGKQFAIHAGIWLLS